MGKYGFALYHKIRDLSIALIFPVPREGTETQHRRNSTYPFHVDIPCSPRGDGNHYLIQSTLRTRQVDIPCSPRGDGNS